MKPKVLFLCTGNSCRSQMAEGWARHLLSDRVEPYSAGIETQGLNPKAVRVMNEAGVDITGQSSKLVSSLADVPLDFVINVCELLMRTALRSLAKRAWSTSVLMIHPNSRKQKRTTKKRSGTIGVYAFRFVNSLTTSW